MRVTLLDSLKCQLEHTYVIAFIWRPMLKVFHEWMNLQTINYIFFSIKINELYSDTFIKKTCKWNQVQYIFAFSWCIIIPKKWLTSPGHASTLFAKFSLMHHKNRKNMQEPNTNQAFHNMWLSRNRDHSCYNHSCSSSVQLTIVPGELLWLM